MKMRPTKLAGSLAAEGRHTADLAAPSIAIDLPLKFWLGKMLRKSWVSYNSPDYLKERHGLPQDCCEISPS